MGTLRRCVRYVLIWVLAAACGPQLTFDTVEGLVISVSQTSITAEQGQSTQVTVTLTHPTDTACDPTPFFSVTGADASLHTSFSTPQGSPGHWTSVLTLSLDDVGPAPRGYGLSIKGTCGFTFSVETGLGLSVTPHPYLLSLSASALTIAQGGNGGVTVNIDRSGGNTSDIALSATGTLPTGMTLGFAPASTTGTSSTLTVTTTTATPVGAYPIVIHGNATGLAEQLVNLTTNVGAACLVISDDFETDQNWIHTPTAPAGFSQSYARLASGGNAAGYARMTHTLAGAGTISVLHLLQTTYDPGLPGNAISRINYSEDQIEFDPPNVGAQIGAGFVIMQDGVAVSRDIGVGGAFGNLSWQTATLPNLTQANFPGINFSGGGPLTFGFLRANSSGGNAYTTTHGIDNFRVEICR